MPITTEIMTEQCGWGFLQAHIRKVVQQFASKHFWLNQTEEELLGLAYEGFHRAWMTYEPERSSLKTHVGNCVWFALKDLLRNENSALVDRRPLGQGKQRRKSTKVGYNDDHKNLGDESLTNPYFSNTLHKPKKSPLIELLKEVSEDAAMVVEIALFAPPMGTKKNPARGSGIKQRTWIVRVLREMGWCGARIAESFREVKDVLFS